MDLKFKDIEIPTENPFQNCKLGRSRYATILESIIATGHEGCVIALNGEWGTGKTTFVKMWEQQLRNSGYETLYFNAWETDFVSDPLIALVGKLCSISKTEKAKKAIVDVTTCAGKIVSKAIPGFAQTIAKKYIGEEATEAIKGIFEGTAEFFQKEIEDFEKECNGLVQFRLSLENFVTSLENDLPLVFIVDELDRCNPHYAVKVLERIKHLFSIPKIIFVLSIDKSQLCNSIRGYYGSDNLNAEEYLRRFIDVDYNLPLPQNDNYINFLCESLQFDAYFFRQGATLEAREERETFCNLAEAIFVGNNHSLRQIQKLLVQTRLVVRTISSHRSLDSIIVLLALYLRMFHNEDYGLILERKFDNQGLLSTLEKILPIRVYKEQRNKGQLQNVLAYAIARFLVVYAAKPFVTGDNPFVKTEGRDLKLLLQAKEVNAETLAHFFDNMWHGAYMDMDYLISHIELLMELEGK